MNNNLIDYSICPICKQNINNHASDCSLKEKELNYYHISWLEIAINNFKNQDEVIHIVEENMTMGEFIKKWGKLL